MRSEHIVIVRRSFLKGCIKLIFSNYVLELSSHIQQETFSSPSHPVQQNNPSTVMPRMPPWQLKLAINHPLLAITKNSRGWSFRQQQYLRLPRRTPQLQWLPYSIPPRPHQQKILQQAVSSWHSSHNHSCFQ